MLVLSGVTLGRGWGGGMLGQRGAAGNAGRRGWNVGRGGWNAGIERLNVKLSLGMPECTINGVFISCWHVVL